MGVHGKLFVVNTSGSKAEIHVKTKSGWKHFARDAGTWTGPKYKISSHTCSPMRRFRVSGKVVVSGQTSPSWSGRYQYFCFGSSARGGLIIADNPAGDGVLVEVVDASKIIKFIRENFPIAPEDIDIDEDDADWRREESTSQEDDDPED